MPIIPQKKAPASLKQAVCATSAAPRRTPETGHPTHEAISKRAYEIWLSSGRPQGCQKEHWRQAEKDLGSRDTR